MNLIKIPNLLKEKIDEIRESYDVDVVYQIIEDYNDFYFTDLDPWQVIAQYEEDNSITFFKY